MKKNFKRLVALVLALIILVPSFASAAERVKLKDALVVGENAYTLDYLAKNSSEVNKAVNKELAKANARIYYVHPSGKAQDLEGKDVNQKDHEVTLHKADGTTEKYKDGFKVEGQTPAPAPSRVRPSDKKVKIAWRPVGERRTYDIAHVVYATISDLPEGATAKWLEEPFAHKVGKDVPGKVQVTFKDGTKEIIEVKVDVEEFSNVLAAKYQAQAKANPEKPKKLVYEIVGLGIRDYPAELKPQEALDPKFLALIKDDVESFEWFADEEKLIVSPNKNTKQGEQKGIVEIQYKDNSYDYVEVKFDQYQSVKHLAESLLAEGKAFKNEFELYSNIATDTPQDLEKNNFKVNGEEDIKAKLVAKNVFTDKFAKLLEKVTAYDIKNIRGQNLVGTANETQNLKPGEYQLYLEFIFNEGTSQPSSSIRATSANQALKLVVKGAEQATALPLSRFLQKGPIYRYSGDKLTLDRVREFNKFEATESNSGDLEVKIQFTTGTDTVYTYDQNENKWKNGSDELNLTDAEAEELATAYSLIKMYDKTKLAALNGAPPKDEHLADYEGNGARSSEKPAEGLPAESGNVLNDQIIYAYDYFTSDLIAGTMPDLSTLDSTGDNEYPKFNTSYINLVTKKDNETKNGLLYKTLFSHEAVQTFGHPGVVANGIKLKGRFENIGRENGVEIHQGVYEVTYTDGSVEHIKFPIHIIKSYADMVEPHVNSITPTISKNYSQDDLMKAVAEVIDLQKLVDDLSSTTKLARYRVANYSDLRNNPFLEGSTGDEKLDKILKDLDQNTNVRDLKVKATQPTTLQPDEHGLVKVDVEITYPCGNTDVVRGIELRVVD